VRRCPEEKPKPVLESQCPVARSVHGDYWGGMEARGERERAAAKQEALTLALVAATKQASNKTANGLSVTAIDGQGAVNGRKTGVDWPGRFRFPSFIKQ